MRTNIFLLCMLLLPVLLWGQDIRYVNGSNLNVRDGAGLNFNVITQFDNGQKVKVISTTKEGDWSHIITEGGIEGYVYSKYLSSGNSTEVDFIEKGNNEEKKDKQSIKDDSSWVKIFLAFLLVYFMFKLFFGGNNETKTTSKKAEKKKIWYHCITCDLLIESTSKPNRHAFACQNKTKHHWIELGEYGDQNYQCSNCNILIQTKKKPTQYFLACEGKTKHRWVKC